MIIFKSDIQSCCFTKEDEHIKVIRPKPGSVLKLTDLNGTIYTITVDDYDFKKASGKYTINDSKVIQKPNPKILIQSIVDKAYLEKLFEILPIPLITKVVLVYSYFSPSQKINMDRLNLILKRSCEQCENPYLPEIILESLPLTEYIYKNSIRPTVLELPSKNSQTINTKTNLVLVGPEGGFSKEESDLFQKLKLPFYSIKSNVLPSWIAGYSYFI